jgi:hypothetical protein
MSINAFTFTPPVAVYHMTDKPTIPTDTKMKSDVSHPGMMGDGTEEQNLDERGNPAARIQEDELDAFGNQKPKK